MRDLITVAEFTIKEMLKRKSFIISMIIILCMIVLGFNVPNIISHFKGDGEAKEKILLIDSENIFEGQLDTYTKDISGYEFEVKNENIPEDEIKKSLEKDYDSCMRFVRKDGAVTIDYVVDSLSYGESMPEELVETFSNIYTSLQISKAGLTEEQLNSLYTDFSFNLVETDENAASGNIFVMLIMCIILFYAIYFCAYQVSSSITTEKTSKIMETLVTSATPKTIVLGKTIGIGIIGLFQVLIIIITGVVSAKLFLPDGVLEGVLDLSNITVSLGILTLVYFLLGYFLYSLMYALTGATVSKPEDIQSANTPIALIAVVGFYLAYFSMMNPTSNVNLFASIFPLSSPFSMPFRIMMGTAQTGEIIASIAVLLVTIIVVAKISIKVYSSAILNYGTKLKLKNILKMYKEK